MEVSKEVTYKTKESSINENFQDQEIYIDYENYNAENNINGFQ